MSKSKNVGVLTCKDEGTTGAAAMEPSTEGGGSSDVDIVGVPVSGLGPFQGFQVFRVVHKRAPVS